MSSGTVYLIDTTNDIVKYRTYSCKAKRNEIIRHWQKLIGPSFERMYIQIAPDIDTSAKRFIKALKELK